MRAERSTFFSGPLPTPEIIGGYEQVLPGAAERVFQMTEKEQEHRHATDRFAQGQLVRESDNDATLAKRSQVCAFLIAVLGLASAVIVTCFGHAVTGAIIGGVDLGVLVTAFLYSAIKSPTGAMRITPPPATHKLETGQPRPALPANGSDKTDKVINK